MILACNFDVPFQNQFCTFRKNCCFSTLGAFFGKNYFIGIIVRTSTRNVRLSVRPSNLIRNGLICNNFAETVSTIICMLTIVHSLFNGQHTVGVSRILWIQWPKSKHFQDFFLGMILLSKGIFFTEFAKMHYFINLVNLKPTRFWKDFLHLGNCT